MNERFESDQRHVALADIVARGESLRRSDLWATGFVHASLLLVFFLALVILSDAATTIWPALRIDNDDILLNLSRLALLAMAAWIFISTSRRSALTRQFEFDLLRTEIKEIQQRMPHSK